LSETTGNAAATDLPRAALTPARLRRWWRRRPVNRALVLLHRWPALVLGLFLVVECTSGAVLLYNGDIFRATHHQLYQDTASPVPVTPDAAVKIVEQAHPQFGAIWVAYDENCWSCWP
jgi:uncharacterized iron-regulated membrane protein